MQFGSPQVITFKTNHKEKFKWIHYFQSLIALAASVPSTTWSTRSSTGLPRKQSPRPAAVIALSITAAAININNQLCVAIAWATILPGPSAPDTNPSKPSGFLNRQQAPADFQPNNK